MGKMNKAVQGIKTAVRAFMRKVAVVLSPVTLIAVLTTYTALQRLVRITNKL